MGDPLSSSTTLVRDDEELELSSPGLIYMIWPVIIWCSRYSLLRDRVPIIIFSFVSFVSTVSGISLSACIAHAASSLRKHSRIENDKFVDL